MLKSVIASLLVASTISAPSAWASNNLRVSHAADVYATYTADNVPYTALDTEDGNRWIISGTLDASRLYAVVFDTQGTESIYDDVVLACVAMD